MTRKVAVLGAGSIGANAARRLLAAGRSVAIVAARGPAALAPLVQDLGPMARATEAAEAVAGADTVFLAVPWTARHAAIRQAGGPGAFADKLVIDAMNPYGAGFRVEALSKRSSEVVADEIGPGAHVVKAFNTLGFRYLAEGARPVGDPERIAIPISGDDLDAKREAAALIDAMGFDTLDTGTLAQSGAQEPGQALYDGALTLPELNVRFAASKSVGEFAGS